MCISCWAPTLNTLLPWWRGRGGKGEDGTLSFDAVIPYTSAEPPILPGQVPRLGTGDAQAMKAGVCSLDPSLLGLERQPDFPSKEKGGSCLSVSEYKYERGGEGLFPRELETYPAGPIPSAPGP